MNLPDGAGCVAKPVSLGSTNRRNSSKCSGPSPTAARPRCSTCPATSERGTVVVCLPMSNEHAISRKRSNATTGYRSQKVTHAIDNALNITTDAANWPSTLACSLPPHPFRRVESTPACGHVFDIWEKQRHWSHTDDFCDMASIRHHGLSVYTEIVNKLIRTESPLQVGP